MRQNDAELLKPCKNSNYAMFMLYISTWLPLDNCAYFFDSIENNLRLIKKFWHFVCLLCEIEYATETTTATTTKTKNWYKHAKKRWLYLYGYLCVCVRIILFGVKWFRWTHTCTHVLCWAALALMCVHVCIVSNEIFWRFWHAMVVATGKYALWLIHSSTQISSFVQIRSLEHSLKFSSRISEQEKP